MIRTDCLHGFVCKRSMGSWSRDLAPGGRSCRKVKQTTASQPKQFQAAVSYENGPQNGTGDPVPPHLLRSSAPHAVDVVVLACARVGGMLEAVKTRMKTLFAAFSSPARHSSRRLMPRGGPSPNTTSLVRTAIPMDPGDATLIARAGPTKDARCASGSSRMAGESRESHRGEPPIAPHTNVSMRNRSVSNSHRHGTR
jgi:hypothetical protein